MAPASPAHPRPQADAAAPCPEVADEPARYPCAIRPQLPCDAKQTATYCMISALRLRAFALEVEFELKLGPGFAPRDGICPFACDVAEDC